MPEITATGEVLTRINYEKLLGEFAEPFESMVTLGVLEAIRESEIEASGFLEDLEKIEGFEEKMRKASQDAANIWWDGNPKKGISGAKDNPDEVVGTTGDREAKAQNFLELGGFGTTVTTSLAYLQQLYFDAGKAQKRLVQIADELKDLSSSLDGCEGLTVSMPSIKGMARASFKADLAKKKRYDELQAKDDLTKEEQLELKDLKKGLYPEETPENPFASGLRDLGRGTVEVPKLSQVIPSVKEFIKHAQKKCPGAELTRFKNKFTELAKDFTANGGYADIQIHIRVDGGHICEMQFNCKSLLDFKSANSERRPGTSWDDLVDNNLLETAKSELDGLDKSDAPKDAEKSFKIFAEGTNGKWFLNAHVIYNITRWLDEKKDDAGAQRVNAALKALSAAAAAAFLKKAEGDEDFRGILKEVGAFELEPGTQF